MPGFAVVLYFHTLSWAVLLVHSSSILLNVAPYLCSKDKWDSLLLSVHYNRAVSRY